MTRAVALFIVIAACSSSEERARQSAEFRLSRDTLLASDVVRTLQPPAEIDRLIYERPADLSYDSLLVKRPELAAPKDRRPPPDSGRTQGMRSQDRQGSVQP